MFQDTVSEALAKATLEVRARYELASRDDDRPVLAPELLYLDEQETLTAMESFPQISVTTFSGPPKSPTTVAFSTKAPLEFKVLPHSEHPYQAFVEFLKGTDDRCLLVAESAGRREVLKSLLRDNDLEAKLYDDWSSFLSDEFPLGITIADLEQGLRLDNPSISVITESQLYGGKVLQGEAGHQKIRSPSSVLWKNSTRAIQSYTRTMV